MNSFNLDKYLPQSFYFSSPVEKKITSIVFNSKEVKEKSIFVAIKGFKEDGNKFIDEAVENGAALIVTETLPKKRYKDVGFLIVKEARIALSILSRKLYNFPDKKLKIIGITGTDGKTSTALVTYNLLKSLNYKVGLISTTNIDSTNNLQPTPFRQSTPEANIVFKLLSECVTNNIEYVVLEATSHALSPYFSRLHGVQFDASIITTITHEHIDFHKSENSYINTKLNLIKMLKDTGVFITTKNNHHLNKCIEKAKELDREYYVVEEEINYRVNKEKELVPISLKYNKKTYKTNFHLPIFLSNALLAVLCINKLTLKPIDYLLQLLEGVKPIKGRFNVVDNSTNRTVIVDFAHTSDSFEKLLSSISFLNKRIITLFGCGGERDIEKRSKMGQVASLYSSIIILTEEDPRLEDNNKIMEDIEKGIQKTENNVKVIKENNRALAIRKAFKESKENDILLFLGKGHETTIERKGVKHPYDETEVVKEVIKNLYG